MAPVTPLVVISITLKSSMTNWQHVNHLKETVQLGTTRTEYSLFTFHRFFTVQAKDVKFVKIQIPILSTNTIPI
jgi:hypothetical protein